MRCPAFRVGHGYDVHRLVPDRKLILGGVEIPFALGLLGHSDADVLYHAVLDAVLGALGLGDIGKHFPDTEEQYRGISGKALAATVITLMKEQQYAVGNIDVTVIAQRPKLAPYLTLMRRNLAEVFGVAPEQINIKATTEEHLGFTGRGEGIAAHAVCLLYREE
ncbi:MAG: 2-C-methyl-D-erythritol 2,4-cyclodiphosphate synthase [Ruminococcaceae bacterium]|nr:2-C-methyl-D-erythritol 2,4-cyclodiphosphate synthase [Oscillospiraceae bacterium]